MSMKLLAIGNVLMKDDGVAIYIAAQMQEELEALGVEVVYGETDISYSLACIKDGDEIIILDAAKQGKDIGEVSLYSMKELEIGRGKVIWHNISIVDLLQLYYPRTICHIITIEAAEVNFYFGLSLQLHEKLQIIKQEIQKKIKMLLIMA